MLMYRFCKTITRMLGGTSEFFARATAHKLNPTIINPDSNFVVVTYWWGRGILNKNTQRPCPEDREDIIEWEGIKTGLLKQLRKKNPNATEADIPQSAIDDEIKEALSAYNMTWKEPIKYDAMIAEWENSCKKHKCNFLAEEYPEFAVKGGYQHAVNFKPYFIDLALAACYPRGVLYIDGDMHIKKYPGVFNTPEVDYMARGWNTDPRVAPWGKPCFDPYTFETSGGTMFFGNTYYGRLLLKLWQRDVLKNPGKADDRIISQTIMRDKLLAPLSMIQLPIEYLWLTLDYDGLFKKYKTGVTQKGVTITHPECLTGEERAEQDSNQVSTRIPRGYVRAVENLISCKSDEIIYEYIQFNDKTDIGPFKQYNDWLGDNKVVTVVPYAKKYGDHNKTVSENIKIIESINLNVHDNLVLVSERDINSVSLDIVSKRQVTSTILKYLINKQHVVYIPLGTRAVRTVLGKAEVGNVELVTKNVSTSADKAKKAYTLKLDPAYPIYFSPNSKVLRHLLLMSESIEDFEKIFNESYIFLTRIRCGWI